MAKKAKVWDGSTWQDLVNATQDLTPYSTTAQMNTAIAAAQGLTLISSTTIGSAVASVTISNCFNSTYDIYELVVSNVTITSTYFKAQLRTGSTTSTSGYAATELFANISNSTVGNDNNFSYSGAGWQMGLGSTNLGSGKATIINPYLARYSTFNQLNAKTTEIGYAGGIHSVSTSYDQLVLTPNSGTWTGGTISIYGYKK
jgi:hypothetical protein